MAQAAYAMLKAHTSLTALASGDHPTSRAVRHTCLSTRPSSVRIRHEADIFTPLQMIGLKSLLVALRSVADSGGIVARVSCGRTVRASCRRKHVLTIAARLPAR
eukprot:scaffold293487_cov30-Tisochrysis_lutea.AAC.4